jgi:cell division transport system ATP-binding protein
MERPVFDNVALPLLIADVPSKERRQRVRAVLDQLGLLPQERALARELSAGEQARVGMARALVTRPSLLLADEPTASLDSTLAAGVMELLRRVNADGVTVVVATHDLHLARDGGRREIALDRGDASANELAALPVIAAVR